MEDSMNNVNDYKVADIELSSFGRKEISLAEKEMPGLMELRKKYGSKTTKRSKDFRLYPHDYSVSCFN